MSSFWPTFCRVFVGVEGMIGVVLNARVILLIWRKKLAANLFTYRIGVTVTAMQGALQNLLAAISCQVHLFHYDQYIIIIYGPVAWVAEIFSDALLFVFVMAAFGIWELIPSTCILQYLALVKPHYSSMRRLMIAYGVCLVLVGYSMPFCTTFHASVSNRQQFTQTVEKVHNLDKNETVRVYGGFLLSQSENDKSVLSLATKGVFPTYLVGYLIFFWTSRRCYLLLAALGDKRSAQTIVLQRKFFRMIILQAFLPLLILSLPLGLFGVALVSGMTMDQQTLVLSFSLWLVPIVQALVSLTFVTRIKSTLLRKESVSIAIGAKLPP